MNKNKNFISVIYPDSTEIDIEYCENENLLLCLLQNNTKIKANCGGFCSCKTCHVYIEENFFKKIDNLNKIQDEELDVLENISNVQYNSRLACQITLTREMNKMKIYISENSFKKTNV